MKLTTSTQKKQKTQICTNSLSTLDSDKRVPLGNL
jgi:hypothetical protein